MPRLSTTAPLRVLELRCRTVRTRPVDVDLELAGAVRDRRGRVPRLPWPRRRSRAHRPRAPSAVITAVPPLRLGQVVEVDAASPCPLSSLIVARPPSASAVAPPDAVEPVGRAATSRSRGSPTSPVDARDRSRGRRTGAAARRRRSPARHRRARACSLRRAAGPGIASVATTESPYHDTRTARPSLPACLAGDAPCRTRPSPSACSSAGVPSRQTSSSAPTLRAIRARRAGRRQAWLVVTRSPASATVGGGAVNVGPAARARGTRLARRGQPVRERLHAAIERAQPDDHRPPNHSRVGATVQLRSGCRHLVEGKRWDRRAQSRWWRAPRIRSCPWRGVMRSTILSGFVMATIFDGMR